ncbi:unnamed protein product, partial [Phaeothamnion confervicola]
RPSFNSPVRPPGPFHPFRFWQPDDDDELRVTHEEGEARFKCPLTTTFFKDPVKSTACGHTYESLAIENHIRNAAKDRKPATCPCCKKPIT